MERQSLHVIKVLTRPQKNRRDDRQHADKPPRNVNRHRRQGAVAMKRDELVRAGNGKEHREHHHRQRE